MTGFADHFSRDSSAYAKFRPTYPPALFGWLATLPAKRSVAWDCGTGTGQAARLLTPYFGRVVASDPSRAQVKAADRGTGARYFAALGETSALATERVDLVTVAQALHWIDRDRFYRELDRVTAPGGALAIWSYGIFQSTPEIDAIVGRFYRDTVGPYWPAERVHVETGYRTIDIPIDEVPSPSFSIEGRLTLPQLLGFIRTWSAVGRYMADRKTDPVVELERELGAVWGDPDETHLLVWPLSLRAGRWRRGLTPAGA
jgi:SAM-dependent methyltransferase